MARTFFVELVLFLAPFLGYALVLHATRRDARSREHWPAQRVMSLAIVGGLLAVAGFLALGLFGGATPGSTYVPAHIENGKLVPGKFK